MENIYNYAILQVIPDARRGERVNIGIVIFKMDGLDIRVSETRISHRRSPRSWDRSCRATTSPLPRTSK